MLRTFHYESFIPAAMSSTPPAAAPSDWDSAYRGTDSSEPFLSGSTATRLGSQFSGASASLGLPHLRMKFHHVRASGTAVMSRASRDLLDHLNIAFTDAFGPDGTSRFPRDRRLRHALGMARGLQSWP